MKEDYHIEDLIFQKEGMVVYRAQGKDEKKYALTVLNYRGSVEERLTEKIFDKAYRDLSARNHPRLRKASDGGISLSDKQIWIAHAWSLAPMLSEVAFQRPLEMEELEQIREDGESLIEGLGDRADCLDFDFRTILIGMTTKDELRSSFVIDYWQWFHDWILQAPFGGGRDAQDEIDRLIASFDEAGNHIIPVQAAPGKPGKGTGPIIMLPKQEKRAPKQPEPEPEKKAAEPAKASVAASKFHLPTRAGPTNLGRRKLSTGVNSAGTTASSSPVLSGAGVRPLRSAGTLPPTTSPVSLTAAKDSAAKVWTAIAGLVVVLCLIAGFVLKQPEPREVKPAALAQSPLEDLPDGMALSPDEASDYEGDGESSGLALAGVSDPEALPTVEEILSSAHLQEGLEQAKREQSLDLAPTVLTAEALLPRVSPNVRPDPTQVSDLEASDGEGLEARKATWVRVSGRIAETSAEGEWSFEEGDSLIAFLEDGQLEMLQGVEVEILGWLGNQGRLKIDEEFDIRFPEGRK